jgi:Ser/Thr protein kinase RdoA (MazF antagonist)
MEQSKNVPIHILTQFDIPGTLHSVEELKRGHINRTYIGHWDVNGSRVRIIHQSVNHRVFTDIEALMGNLEIVTEALRKDLNSRPPSPGETTLTLIRTKDGASYLKDESGEFWRSFEYIENTVSYDVCPSSHVAREAAAILGRFQRALSPVSARSLKDTIPYFHHGVRRYEAFARAVKADKESRVKEAMSEIDFAQSRRELGGALISAVESGKVPTRVSHNDMKLNNVLFNSAGDKAICLLDLDTCMAGTPLFDFGDLVRNTAVPCAEDEQDFSKVMVDMKLYKAICEGYLSEVATMLTKEELSLLSVAPRVLALILGVRFLTDYLDGDNYFRIHRPRHNLERARTQFEIVRAMERLDQEMAAHVNSTVSAA